jgi:hypothetical protein
MSSTQTATTNTIKMPLPPSTSTPKKLKHKGSKPIFNWLTRKLVGGGGGPRHHGQRPEEPPPLPPLPPFLQAQSTRGRTVSLIIPLSQPQPTQNTVLLNEPSPVLSRTRSHGSSAVPESLWAPSQTPEADDDASIRPLPPTSPPSPSPSRSSSSQLSDPRTFRSAAASTKPTTLTSLDSGHGGNGILAGTMAHIAQVPSPSSIAPSPSNPRFSSGPIVHPAVVRAASQSRSPSMQVPLHTHHHPRNNPNPSSPPLDNASTLTLASSAYANPIRGNEWTDGASLSVSYHYHGDMDVSSSNLDVDDADEAEAAASLRALRPRSSRRGSWDSVESRWSARVGGGNATPSVISGTRATSLGGGSASAVNRATSIKIKAFEQDGISVSEDKSEEMFVDHMESDHVENDHGDTMKVEKESAKSLSVQEIVIPAIALESVTPPTSSKPAPIQETDANTPVMQPAPLADA